MNKSFFRTATALIALSAASMGVFAQPAPATPVAPAAPAVSVAPAAPAVTAAPAAVRAPAVTEKAKPVTTNAVDATKEGTKKAVTSTKHVAKKAARSTKHAAKKTGKAVAKVGHAAADDLRATGAKISEKTPHVVDTGVDQM